ncbi:hypothetical protein CIK05_05210 [Bdellovibrio sp. qaytius]|nr:hypothetical protein CIK05_05210 [Bdellovibrio sp. qaytius]
MIVTKFLERKWVIQLFGFALIVAPFVNILIQFLVLNSNTGLSWRYISISSFLLSGSIANYILALGSVSIGIIMLSGSTKAWKAVLGLVGIHLIVQILNYKSKEWQGTLGWGAFAVNLSVFLFIADQLVWRVKSKEELFAEAMNRAAALKPTPKVKAPEPAPLQPTVEVNAVVPEADAAPVVAAPVAPETPGFVLGSGSQAVEKILHLKSYKKIFFSFGSDRPWGRLMTLNSHQLIVNCFEKAPESIENKVVAISFTKNLVIDIKFDRKESNLYYFTPLDMTPARVTELNQWLKKIAV